MNQKKENGAVIEYQTDHGNVKLSPAIVKKYLVSGNGNVTDQEVVMFMQLCRFQGLNPFLREAYLIKYGEEQATMVTGKDTFTKRAAKIKECKGYNAGTVCKKKDGTIVKHMGAVVYDDEVLVGGWAVVYRENWTNALEIEVSLKEYARYNKKGELMRNWATMPATMIR